MNNSPYAGRDRTKKEHLTDRYISIHSPHAGRDNRSRFLGRYLKGFQSTLPMRGET